MCRSASGSSAAAGDGAAVVVMFPDSPGRSAPPHTLSTSRPEPAPDPVKGWLGLLCGGGQGEHEARAAPHLGVQLDPSPMLADDLGDDAEPEPAAALRPRPALVDAVEAVEDVRPGVLRDADAVVAHRHRHAIGRAPW